MGCKKLTYHQETDLKIVHFRKELTSKSSKIKERSSEPFGMEQPGRSFSSDAYRHGFQGQEVDNEIKGKGNSVNFKFRMHDPRLGRFLSIDPLAPDYPWNSPYAFSENRVVDGVELEGLEVENYLEDFLKELGAAAIEKATDAAIELAIKYTKAVVEDFVDHTEVTLIASVSIDYKIGGGIAGQIDKVGGGEIDLTSVRLANFKGTIDLLEGKVDGEFYYFGEDNEFITSQKVSGSVPILPGVGVGSGYSIEEKNNFETEESTVTKQINAGVGIGIFNMTITGEKVAKNGQIESSAVTGSGGVSGSGGAIVVGSVDVNVSAKVQYNND